MALIPDFTASFLKQFKSFTSHRTGQLAVKLQWKKNFVLN